MAKFKVWHVNVEGMDYEVKAGRANPFKSFALTVNDRPVALPNPFLSQFTGMDAQLQLGSKVAHFVMTGNKMDLAVDGVYLDSGKTYLPNEKIPMWAWIFVAGYIPMFIMGGAVSWGLSVLGTMLTLRTSVKPDKTTITKIMISLGLEIGLWIIWFVVAISLAMLLAAE